MSYEVKKFKGQTGVDPVVTKNDGVGGVGGLDANAENVLAKAGLLEGVGNRQYFGGEVVSNDLSSNTVGTRRWLSWHRTVTHLEQDLIPVGTEYNEGGGYLVGALDKIKILWVKHTGKNSAGGESTDEIVKLTHVVVTGG